MSDEELKEIVARLDRELPRDGAWAYVQTYAGENEQMALAANRAGCLRLGVELLKAADAPVKADGPIVDVDVSYLMRPNIEVGIDWLQRSEDLPPIEEQSWLSRAAGYGCGWLVLGVLIVGVGAVLLGLVRFLAWLFP